MLADLVPPPRKHRHRYHGVFAPNHTLRRAVTALAIANVGNRNDVTTIGHGGDGHGTGGCCAANQKPRSHDTSRIAWAKLLARVGAGVSARVPELRRRHPADRVYYGAGPDLEDPDTPRRTTRATTDVARSWPAHRLGRATPGGGQPFREQLMRRRKTRHQPHQPPIGSEMPVDMVAEVPLTGLPFFGAA